MAMFGMFGGKKATNGTEIGDWGDDMVGMMKMLAGMPQMMRKPMMKGRISQILSLPEERRQESIRQMFGAFHSTKVKEKARETLIATRVEIIGELSEAQRRTVMASRLAGLKPAPQLDEADRAVQEKVLPKVSQRARDTFTSSWDYVTGQTQE